MKTIYSLLAILLITPLTWAADSISLEEFKKITNEDERLKMIEQAPPEQREQLGKINYHLELLRHWGGEAGLQKVKESYVSKARGLGGLESMFKVQMQVWDSYVAGVIAENKKAGMSPDKQAAIEDKLTKEQAAIAKRLPIVHSLVFNMAASPKSLELEKRAEKLIDDWGQRAVSDGTTPYQFITREERMDADKQMDQIFEEMQKLPKLTPEQIQKEYNEFPEEQIQRKITCINTLNRIDV